MSWPLSFSEVLVGGMHWLYFVLSLSQILSLSATTPGARWVASCSLIATQPLRTIARPDTRALYLTRRATTIRDRTRLLFSGAPTRVASPTRTASLLLAR